MKKSVRIILVDDHPLMRLGIKSSLSSYDEIVIVAETSSADELFIVLTNTEVDVILLDIQMPGTSCEVAVRKIKSEYENVKIIILSSQSENDVIFRLLRAGIDGFVTKTSNVEVIKKAISEVCLGSKYYGTDVLRIIGEGDTSQQDPIIMELTGREKEVTQLCCDGLLSKEIAKRLNISPRTVEMHKSNIFKKLNVNNTIELLKWAIEHGVVKI